MTSSVNRKKIMIVRTGGTIAMVKKGREVVPLDQGSSLVTDIPGLHEIADVELFEFSNIPSPSMTPMLMWELAKKIDDFLENRDTVGRLLHMVRTRWKKLLIF